MRSLPLLLLLLFPACVGKKKYNAALAENAAQASQLSELNDTLSMRLADISSLEANKSELEQTKASLESELSRLNGELDEARTSLAKRVAEAGSLKTDIDKMKLALKELEIRRAQTEATLATFRDLVSRFRSMIDAGTLKVKVVDGRMLVELATDILFPSGSASLSADGKTTVGAVAEVLASIKGRKYQIAGHTDNVPINNERFTDNWDLGAARSITVARLLIQGGLPAERVSAASYAETVPVAANTTKEGKSQNRRIEIVIVPDLSEMPGYEELKALATESR